MANPQAENGHTDIAHELIEALAKIKMSGSEWQCLMVIFRKTYGWHKTKEMISLSYFELKTGLPRQTICRAINSLVTKSLLIVTKSLLPNKTNNTNTYKINKNYDLWCIGSHKTMTTFKGSHKINTKVVTKSLPNKKEKETKKKNINSYTEEFSKFWGFYPKRKGKKEGKYESSKLFNKLSAQDKELATWGAFYYSKSQIAEEGYTKDAERFLKKRLFEDWQEPQDKPEEIFPF